MMVHVNVICILMYATHFFKVNFWAPILICADKINLLYSMALSLKLLANFSLT